MNNTNNTFHGDCLDVLPLIPDMSIDMVLCDLPYGITQNKWDSVIPLSELWAHYKRICRGPVVLTASQPFSSALVMSNPEMFRHEWVWIKNRGSNFANVKREPFKEHESVLVFSRKGWTYNPKKQPRTGGGLSRSQYDFSPDKTDRSGLGEFSGAGIRRIGEMRSPSSWQKFNTEVGLHPTQKPVSLFAYLIETYTNPGATVLDNCAGSGTTAIACIRTGRNFVCIEIDDHYFEICQSRIAQEIESNRE